MEILASCNWLEVDENEEPNETAEPSGDQLPIGSDPGGADDPETDYPDFEIVSELLTEGSETTEKEEDLQEKEGVEGDENDTGSVELSEVVDHLGMLEIQLGVIDLVLVLALLLFIFKSFIRVPR